MTTWNVAKIDRGFGAERAMKRQSVKMAVLSIGWALGAGTVAMAANDAWLVGPGLDFPDLVSGVAGAADGDLLVVISTPQQDVVINDKSISIVGVAVQPVKLRSITIRNLAASRKVEVRGVAFSADGSQESGGPTIRVEHSQGIARFEECATSPGTNSDANTAIGVDISSSAHVSFTRCSLSGGSGKAGWNPDHFSPLAAPAWDGAPGIRSVHSSVSVFDSVVEGGDGGPVIQDLDGDYPWDAADGAAAVRIEGGRFFASGGSLIGGSPGNPGYEYDLHVGVVAGAPGLGGSCVENPSGNAILLGGVFDTGGTNVRASWEPVTVYSAMARSLIAPRLVQDGGSMLLTYDGEAGDSAIAFGSAVPDFQAYPAGELGVWMLGLPTLVGPIALPAVGPAGSPVAASVVLPALPTTFEFVSITFQAATVDSDSGATILSSPTIVAEVSDSVPVAP